jgi:hypothetical protein
MVYRLCRRYKARCGNALNLQGHMHCDPDKVFCSPGFFVASLGQQRTDTHSAFGERQQQ